MRDLGTRVDSGNMRGDRVGGRKSEALKGRTNLK
jgi:hypothetical protein